MQNLEVERLRVEQNWMGESRMRRYTLKCSAEWLDCARPAWVKAADGRFLDANDAFGDLFGASPNLRGWSAGSIRCCLQAGRYENSETTMALCSAPAVRWCSWNPPDSIDALWCATVKFPLRYGSRGTPAIGGVSFPVTEWLHLEERLGAEAQEPPGPPAWLLMTRTLIAAGFRTSLWIRDLAMRLGMNPDHVGRAFAEHTGVTVLSTYGQAGSHGRQRGCAARDHRSPMSRCSPATPTRAT
jgi:hypothetical protein